MTSNGSGHSITYKTHVRLAMILISMRIAQAHQSHCFVLISQTAKLSLGERWAHMQFCRKCCASAEISEILLAGFIFKKFLARPCRLCGRSLYNVLLEFLHCGDSLYGCPLCFVFVQGGGGVGRGV